MEKLLTQLNPVQRQAVTNTDGPMIILAGAGSGKTRVLTHRISYLISARSVRPYHILAVTFTNKAAGEMKSRIQKMVGPESKDIWVGTFHSVFAKTLRYEAEKIGYDRNFVIYDSDDQMVLVKQLMDELKISRDQYNAKGVRSRISQAKNRLETPAAYQERAEDIFEEKTALVYRAYQAALRRNNAFDFDDLITKPIELFEDHPEVLEFYQEKFRYVHIDEYQDTNHAQYLLMKMLARKHKNICVVGDDDQSIYGWRGADLSNILNFEKDYDHCRIFKLEQNYRSTKNILRVANSVVRNNQDRKEKELWTDHAEGEKIVVSRCGSDIQEGRVIAETVKKEIVAQKRQFLDFAVLYRTNAQSRSIEDAFRRYGIPYVIVGGVRFYERKEIKDVLAYLKLVSNPKDSVSLMRIVNYPTRGIGKATVAALEDHSARNGGTLFDAIGSAERIAGLGSRAVKALRQFHEMVFKYMQLRKDISLSELVRAIVDEIGILRTFKQEQTPDSISRYENVSEFLSAVTEFITKRAEEREDDDVRDDLDAFLEEVSLISDVDQWEDDKNAVTLMTLHSAKGLEFPVVAIAGLEEGLFPLGNSLGDRALLEEERRLFYVGVTRAMEKCYLAYASERMRFGERFQAEPSRFLSELPEEVCDFFTTATELVARSGRPRRSRASYSNPPVRVKNSHYRVGAFVEHRSFGRGQIVNLEGKDESLKVSVIFENGLEKKLMVKYANLVISKY